jgi:ketosteroid isomerase-like protein
MTASQSDTALEAFHRYAAAFRSLDPRAVVPCFHEPAISVFPTGVASLATGAQVAESYRRVMAELPSRGYATTEFSRLTERQLGDDLAMVSGNGAWKNDAGEDLSRFGLTYLFRRVVGHWKVVLAAIHDPLP